MRNPAKLLLTLATAAAVVLTTPGRVIRSSDKELVPSQLPKEEQTNLQRFLQEHEKPAHYFPPDAKLVASQPASVDTSVDRPAGQAVKQYMVQITAHRPV